MSFVVYTRKCVFVCSFSVPPAEPPAGWHEKRRGPVISLVWSFGWGDRGDMLLKLCAVVAVEKKRAPGTSGVELEGVAQLDGERKRSVQISENIQNIPAIIGC